MIEGRFSLLLFHTGMAGALLGGVGTLYFFLGLAGAIAGPWPNWMVAAALGSVLAFFFREFWLAFKEGGPLGRGLWCAILAIIIIEIILGTVPPTARDELTHHLVIPRLYVQAGRIIEVPMAPYSYYPMLLDMLYTPWIFWRLDFVPKMVHHLFGLLTGLLLYAYLSDRMNSIYGLLGFFFFLSIPSVLRLSHWAYVDLGVTFFSTAALLSLLRWNEIKAHYSWLALAAVSGGFAVATKPNGLVAFLLLVLLVAWQLARPPRLGITRSIGALVLFGLVGALPFLPWLAKNWYQTSNPFFPLLRGLFSSTGAAVAAPEQYASVGIFAKRELLYGESWWEIAALPLRVFFFGQDDNPQYFDGVLSPILIVFLPWAFKGKWRGDKVLLFSFALLFLAYALLLVDLRVRYILPIVPTLIILFSFAVFNLYLRIKQPAYLFVVLISFAAYHGFYLYRYMIDVAPLPYLTGSESRAAYLTKRLPEYGAFQYINEHLPASAKIYLLFVGRRGYYCQRDYFHDGGDLPAYLLSAIRSAREPAQVGDALKRQGITHLMVRADLLGRYLVNNLSPAEIELWNAFATGGLSWVFDGRGYVVYKLNG